MKKATVIINIPTIKHISDNLRIPMPTPDTVDIVAIAVIHQILTTYNIMFIFIHNTKYRQVNSMVTQHLNLHPLIDLTNERLS